MQAFNTAKTAGKEIMILQLEQLMLNYPKTPEGIKAKEMLQFLKSDLKVEQLDANGNPINKSTSNAKIEDKKVEIKNEDAIQPNFTPNNSMTPPKIKNKEMYEPDLPPLKPVEPKKDR